MNTFKNWIAAPFAVNMDAFHWFLFYGLVLIIALSWHMIERAIKL
jgi:hypothetical protein